MTSSFHQRGRSRLGPVTLLTAGLALAACSALPGSGPRTVDIEHGDGSYTLIDLNAVNVRSVAAVATAPKPELPPGRVNGLIGAGDLLKIALWEPNPAGTSLTADKAGIDIAARVGIDGTIGVPYVGRVHAAGRTPAQMERDIQGRLASVSPGAQVAVLVTEDLTNDVIVQGDVGRPGRYPVVPGSSGVLDILAMAGGAHTSNRQGLVRITRGGHAVTRTLSQLIGDRTLEGDLAPGDRILVLPRTANYYAFGAVNRPGEQPYDADELNLSNVLARLAGLSDDRADPAAVFVYRRDAAAQTIYRLNLRDPSGFFVAQAFPVLPNDTIYVSNAPIAEAAKVFQLLIGVSNIGAMPRNMGAQY
jgi:polysaccharide biosynthesis/export protein